MNSNSPIAVFDSGIGGLSVLRHIRQQLAGENLLYVADSAYAPYGKRNVQEILDRCIAIADYFIAQEAKAIVVACNTATAVAIEALRQRLSIPVIGMEPGLKPALASTRSGKVAVLATDNTLASEKFESLVKRFQTHQEVRIQPFTELVSFIESGNFESPEIQDALRAVLPPLITDGVDTLVLGCSHYPLIFKQIQQIAGKDVLVIDTGDAIARELSRQLENRSLLNETTNQGQTTLLSSSEAPQTLQIIKNIWPDAIKTGSVQISTEHA